ncbi:Hydroxyacid-oxoacid transhydrogenase [Aphelenchoides besseyi]|nr:Hydroxyacid-oxoacid transhydrogenase [Aphelenchoides besseyi]
MTSLKARTAQNILRLVANARLSCPHHSNCGESNHFEPLTRKHSTDGHTCDYAFRNDQFDSAFRSRSHRRDCSRRQTTAIEEAVGYHGQERCKDSCIHVRSFLLASLTSEFSEVAGSFSRNGVEYKVFDNVLCEPSEKSMIEAVEFAKNGQFDCFIAVGGGSVIDTTKAAALYSSNPDADFLDFVQPPFGRGILPTNAMKPLIAVPTTAGTGSETTGVSIFDLPEKECKTGIRLRAIKPLLAIVDPLNVMSMPRNVAIYSGFDVLCHALESYTAKPYTERGPRPNTPAERPVYQGSNPISDVWVREALRIITKYFRRAVFNPDDAEARTHMMMASSFAGMGFGNAGVHLCHGLSYPISSQGKKYVDPDYDSKKPLIPHGLSVVTTAPADFIFTTPAYPQRHLEAANLLGADLPSTASDDLIANRLADLIRGYMQDYKVPNGLGDLGFDRRDVDKLADRAAASLKKGAIAPRDPDVDALAEIYEKSLSCY